MPVQSSADATPMGSIYLFDPSKSKIALRPMNAADSAALASVRDAVSQHLALVRSDHQRQSAARSLSQLNSFLCQSKEYSRPRLSTSSTFSSRVWTIAGCRFQVEALPDDNDVADAPNRPMSSSSNGKKGIASTSCTQTGATSEPVAHKMTLNHSSDTTLDDIRELFEDAAFRLCEANRLDGAMFLDLSHTGTDMAAVPSTSPAAVVLGRHVPEMVPEKAEGSAKACLDFPIKELQRLSVAFPKGAVLDRLLPETPVTDIEASDQPLAQAVTFIFLPFSNPEATSNAVACLTWVSAETWISDWSGLLLSMSALGRAAILRATSTKATAEDLVKSRFISSVTHELRSPLHGILGGLEFLRAAQLEGFEQHILDTIESCGRTLLDTVENVLQMSGIGTAHDVKPPTELASSVSNNTDSAQFAMIPLIEDVIMSALLGHITQKRAELRADSDEHGQPEEARKIMKRSNSSKLLVPRLPQVVIQTDWSREWVCSASVNAVRRVVLNLFVNALKFTTSGHIMISSRKSKSIDKEASGEVKPSGEGVSLVVTDSGRGMSKQWMDDHVGKAFQQEDVLDPGTGLGLHLTSHVVSTFGGSIEFESAEGVGTSVQVSIPTSQLLESSFLPESSKVFSAVKGRSVFMLGWNITENSRNKEGLRLAKESFTNLFIDRFSMKVDSGNADEFTGQDVILVDDLCFESLRAEGVMQRLGETNSAVLVFCSSIRYAAAMASEFRQMSFLTPPPGPNQLSRVLARYFREGPLQDEAISTYEQRTENMLERSKQSEGLMQQLDYATANSLQKSVSEKPLSKQVSPESSSTIMLVEDNPVNLKLLVRLCQKNSLRYVTATNGLEAVNIYKQEGKSPPSIIIMDISMPVMDGLASTRSIRALEAEQGLKPAKIIALTAVVSADASDNVYEAGCDLFMAKPASFGELLKNIKQYKTGQSAA